NETTSSLGISATHWKLLALDEQNWKHGSNLMKMMETHVNIHKQIFRITMCATKTRVIEGNEEAIKLFLEYVPGETSFEFLRTVDGEVCQTFKNGACRGGGFYTLCGVVGRLQSVEPNRLLWRISYDRVTNRSSLNMENLSS
ncbi:hypothetical protein CBL_20535, partial [Carabus blaptoides fortunei]